MFAENLKKIRKDKGYTQEILAEKLNVVRQTVSKWETGCGALCAPFAPAGKQAEFLRMGMSKKSGCFQRTAAGI